MAATILSFVNRAVGEFFIGIPSGGGSNTSDNTCSLPEMTHAFNEPLRAFIGDRDAIVGCNHIEFKLFLP